MIFWYFDFFFSQLCPTMRLLKDFFSRKMTFWALFWPYLVHFEKQGKKWKKNVRFFPFGPGRTWGPHVGPFIAMYNLITFYKNPFNAIRREVPRSGRAQKEKIGHFFFICLFLATCTKYGQQNINMSVIQKQQNKKKRIDKKIWRTK